MSDQIFFIFFLGVLKSEMCVGVFMINLQRIHKAVHHSATWQEDYGVEGQMVV